MEVLIAGTGALACLFAARLSAAGCEVTMLGSWPEGLSALRKHGVCLHDLDGRTHTYPVQVMDGSEDKAGFLQSMFLVKSWQTEQVAKKISQYISNAGITLTLQNGLGNDELLRHHLGPQRVALGVTTVGARMLGPAEVQFTGKGKVSIGNHPRLSKLTELLLNAGFELEVVADPISLLWGKLVINAAINPLTALLKVPNGMLLERPGAHELMIETAREAALVAARQGIVLPYDDPVTAVEKVAQATAPNYSSMLQDVMRGANTEIEAINGAIVRTGERLGLAPPVNRVLWQLVKSLDQH